MRCLFLISGLIGLNVPGVAAAQTGGPAWQPMAFHDFQVPSATDPLQSLIWPDVIREANATMTTELKRPLDGRNARVTALSSSYKDGSRTIIVSIALSRQCDSGANDKDAEIEPSICPVRVAVLDGNKLVSITTATGCYVDHEDPDLPAKNRSDDTFTRFDRASGTITLRTVVGGKTIPSCSSTMVIK
ncbi:hypothetical protein [Lichenifustis flavocetrariae]|uniref:Uncharacterized protein n=1 Tax=Lichenifustis flavocetrariae TaxID=2949735 RepID=A0AA41Z498_9HYPH|nr:hypothetical protein [Lichenifustis flavocetrariae]MCW6512525.1 hypothetical protein [Lichenifustis flavocetrariae]